MTAAKKMSALLLEEAGGPFRLTQVSRPVPGPGEVLVRVRASGINPLDVKIRAGAAPHARHPLPAILGIDLAGTVEEPGRNVTAFAAGDEVWGMTGGVAGVPGSLAEFAAVDARLLAHKPASLSMIQAAALPLAVITAMEGLDHVVLGEDTTLLVLGGAGGVGHAAVQIARARGSRVFATASARDADYLSSLGATPIDRGAAISEYVDLHTAGRGFDVVYDTVGGAVLDQAFQSVRRAGHVISCLGWGTHSLAPLSFRAASYSGVFTLLPLLTGEGRKRQGGYLSEAAALADAGRLVPRVDPRHFSLTSVADAYALVEQGTARGKVVIDLG